MSKVFRRVLSMIIQHPVLFCILFLCAALIAVFLVYRISTRKKRFSEVLSRELHRIPEGGMLGDKSGSIEGHLDDYVPPYLRDLDKDSDDALPFDSFVREIRHGLPGLTVVCGPMGAGKTDLLFRLAYEMRRKPIKPVRTLCDYGEVFLDLSQYTDVQSAVDELSRKTQGKKPVTVFLDSFDALCAACADDADTVLNRFLNQLCRSDLYDRCLHLVMTTRLDVFSAGVPSKDDLPTHVYAIRPFTVRQGRALYEMVSKRSGEQKAARQANLKKIDRLFRAETPFTRPFVLKWAPEVLADNRKKDAEDISLFDILDAVITREVRRICKSATDGQAADQNAAVRNLKKEAAFRAFARAAALAAVGDRVTRCLPADSVRQAAQDCPEGTFDALLVTAEHGAGIRKQAVCCFPDSLILCGLLADAAADPATTPDDRARVRAAAGTELQSICLEAVYSRHRNALDYPSSEQFCTDVKERRRMRVRKGGTTADVLYALVPGIRTLTLGGCAFDDDRTEDLMENGVLDLYGRGRQLPRVLSCLSPSLVKTLELSDVGKEDTDVIMNCVGRLPSLEELDMADCTADLERLLRECPDADRVRLMCTVGADAVLPADARAYRFREVGFVLPRTGFPLVYETLYRLRRGGAPVTAASRYDCGPCDTCDDLSRIEAVYAMERQRLTAEEARKGGLLEQEQYVSAFRLAVLLSERPEASALLDDAALFLRDRVLIWDTRTIRCPIRCVVSKDIQPEQIDRLITVLSRRTKDAFIRMADVCRRDVQSKGDRSGFLTIYRSLAEDGNVYAMIWLGMADQYGYYGLPIDPSGALRRFRAAAERASASGEPGCAADACRMAGDILSAAGKDREAESFLRRAWEIRMSRDGLTNAETARAADALGTVLARFGNREEAAERLSEAYSAREKALGADHADTVGTGYRLGSVLTALGRYEEGAAILESVSDARAAKLGDTHIGTAQARFQLGRCLFGIGRFDRAAEAFGQAYAVQKAKLGPDHAETAETLSWLGRSLDEERHDEQAAGAYRDVLTVWERNGKTDDADTADICGRLGAVLYRRSQRGEAEAVLNRVLNIRERLSDTDSPDAGRTTGLLGLILFEEGRFSEAVPVLRKAVKADNGDMTVTAYDRYRLGVSLHRTGRDEEASAVMETAITELAQAVGSGHADTVEACRCQARILESLGRHEEAARCLNRVRVYDEKQFGEQHPDLAATYLELGIALTGAGRTAEAGTYLGKAQRIRETLSGPEHPDTAEVLYRLGVLACTDGQYQTAASYLSRSQRIFEVKLDKNDTRTADAELWLARALSRMERHSEAWVMLEKALRIREINLGRVHEGTAEVYRELGDVLIRLGRSSEASICRRKEADIRAGLKGR